MQRSRKAAFTLIELLVVIAIIAIEVYAYHGNRLYVANVLTTPGPQGDICNMTMLDGHTKTFHRGQLNADVVNRFNPDWMVGGIGGMDFPS